MLKLPGTRAYVPSDMNLATWCDSNYNAPWCTLMVVGDAGIDFVDQADEITPIFWRIIAYIRRS